MGYNSRNSGPKNYSFVRFPEKPYVEYITSLAKRNDASETRYSGYLELEIKTIDYLHIGSGFSRLDNRKLISEVSRTEQTLIIPGSSLKGAVRQICRATSDGCIPDEYGVYRTSNQKAKCSLKKEDFHCCIVCDMFGGMSLGSKLRFTDLTAEKGRTELIPVRVQFSPNANTDSYQDDSHHTIGYKFYYTICDIEDCDTEDVEAVSEGIIFKGKIYFKWLDKKELCLLAHALGLAKNFSMKLGGYKNDGLGTVETKCVKMIVNGKEEDAVSYAENYLKEYAKEVSVQIDDLKRIMEYQGGIK